MVGTSNGGDTKSQQKAYQGKMLVRGAEAVGTSRVLPLVKYMAKGELSRRLGPACEGSDGEVAPIHVGYVVCRSRHVRGSLQSISADIPWFRGTIV